MSSLKVLAAVAVAISATATFAFVAYQNRNYHTKQPEKTEDVISFAPWEYFKELPSKFAANYYPKKDSKKEILIEPSKVHTEPNKASVTFLVQSEPGNYARRKVIRGTWGSVPSYLNFSLRVIFVTGFDDANQVRLRHERNTTKDILQVNITEDPLNQPVKILTAFYWAGTKDNSSYYITTKDNFVINIYSTIRFLTQNLREVEESIHCGFMFENNTGVIRGRGPRSIASYIYEKGTYPAFCRSGLVILSKKYVQKIYEESTITKMDDFHLEDVLLYGILREKLRIENSIKNILNGGQQLAYYPWSDTDEALKKMVWKWQRWNEESKNKEVKKMTPSKKISGQGKAIIR